MAFLVLHIDVGRAMLGHALFCHKHTSESFIFNKRTITIVICQIVCKLFYYKLTVGPYLTGKSFALNLSILCVTLTFAGNARLTSLIRKVSMENRQCFYELSNNL